MLFIRRPSSQSLPTRLHLWTAAFAVILGCCFCTSAFAQRVGDGGGGGDFGGGGFGGVSGAPFDNGGLGGALGDSTDISGGLADGAAATASSRESIFEQSRAAEAEAGAGPGVGAAGSTFGRGGLGGGGFGGVGGLGGFGGGFGGLGGLFGNAFGQQGGGTTQPAIRTRLRSGIRVAPLAPNVVRQNAVRSLNRIQRPAGSPGVRVQMSGRTATLTGDVGSDRDRRMSELLLRLEPGVTDVQNDLRVRGDRR